MEILGLSYKHSVNNVMHPAQHVFDFYSDKDKIKAGTLVCHKSEIKLRPNYDKPVLAIDFLEVTNKAQGIGTKILKFAEEFSRKSGCNGFMTLKSDVSFMPEKIPHTFYRKFGFSTLEKKTDKKLDMFIRQNKDATHKDFPCLLMHYPPMAEKNSFSLKNIALLLKQFFRLK